MNNNNYKKYGIKNESYKTIYIIFQILYILFFALFLFLVIYVYMYEENEALSTSTILMLVFGGAISLSFFIFSILNLIYLIKFLKTRNDLIYIGYDGIILSLKEEINIKFNEIKDVVFKTSIYSIIFKDSGTILITTNESVYKIHYLKNASKIAQALILLQNDKNVEKLFSK